MQGVEADGKCNVINDEGALCNYVSPPNIEAGQKKSKITRKIQR